MRFVSTVYWIAAVYGIIVLLAGLFAEPAGLAQPGYYYGFFCLGLVWQLVFILIARNPSRNRHLIPITILEKAAFFVPVMLLRLGGRPPANGIFVGGLIDGALMLLFALAWFRSKSSS